MRTLGIAGVASIDCPRCGHTLHDFDPPQVVHGVARVTAHCHVCNTDQRLEVDHDALEAWVTCLGDAPWESQP